MLRNCCECRVSSYITTYVDTILTSKFGVSGVGGVVNQPTGSSHAVCGVNAHVISRADAVLTSKRVLLAKAALSIDPGTERRYTARCARSKWTRYAARGDGTDL